MGCGVWLVCCSIIASAIASRDEELTVMTESGPVKGHYVEDGKVIQFLGIPYAAPPTGEFRFDRPHPAQSWTEALIADRAAPGCPQNCTTFKLACPERVSEDCLYLNVWAPARSNVRSREGQREKQHASAADVANSILRSNPGSLSIKSKWQLKAFEDSFIPVNLVQEAKISVRSTSPVFFFIHGGLFTEGHGASSVYNGSDIASAGVVVVSINYRLGALGSLALGPELSGNFGFQDQNFALKWVQRNIAGFGGDRNQVTLGGQSAGAISVAMHMTSPASDNLFSQAILESPVLGLPLLTQEQAVFEMGKDFVDRLGCSVTPDSSPMGWSAPQLQDNQQVVQCLRNASISDIVDAQAFAVGQISSVRKLYGSPYFSSLILPWSPVIDGEWIMGQPLALIQSGQWRKMPVLAGFTKDEFASFIPVVIPELGTYSYDALIYAYFGLRVSSSILEQYPASEPDDQRAVLAQVVRDMFVACPLRFMTRNNTFPAYLYRFDHILKDSRLWSEYQTYCSNSACHSSELAIVFSGRFAPERTHLQGNLTEMEQVGADTLHEYWVRFIQSSDPNGSELYPWPRSVGSGPYLVVETPFELAAAGVNSSRCDLWDEIGYFW